MSQATITPTDTPGIGYVQPAQRYDKRGEPLERPKFYVGIACEHWAPADEPTDCRFGCIRKAG